MAGKGDLQDIKKNWSIDEVFIANDLLDFEDDLQAEHADRRDREAKRAKARRK